MKRPALIFTAATACLALSAFAETTETFNYSDFDALKTSAGISVVFKKSPNYSVIAKFDRGDRDDIEVKQTGDVLYLSRRQNRFWREKNNARVVIYVTAPDLERIETTSGSSLEASGISADDFKLRVSSGGSAKVSGTCARMTISASSGGAASAKAMKCQSVSAKASSGGSVAAHATASADSDTSSGGSVVIFGNPGTQTANRSMSGGSTDFK